MKALIIVDVQNDFLPGGALPVPGGFDIIEPILHLAEVADVVVKTEDAHPEETGHFNRWPRHCVSGTPGQLMPLAIERLPGPVFPKGTHPDEDGYSGFSNRSLERYLPAGAEVTVVGLALDYCVMETALDAAKLGYEVTVDLAATRAVAEETGKAAIAALEVNGVQVVFS